MDMGWKTPSSLVPSLTVFLLTLHWPTGDSCEHIYTNAGGITGHFQSPGYPKPYQPDTHCRYIFQGTRDERIRIDFDDFDLEEQFESKGCLYDYVDIFTIDTDNVKHFEDRLCGNKKPEPIISIHQTVELVFKSDYKPEEFKGFKGRYEFIDERWQPFPKPDPVCGPEYITGGGGEIMSPNWPDPYPGQIQCTWMIRVEHERKILINLLEMDLGQSVHCKDTYISIYNGFASDKGPPDRKFCGSLYFYKKGDLEIGSKSHRVVIRFIASNNDYGNPGFHLAWTSVKIPQIMLDMSTGEYFEEPCKEFHCAGGEYCIDTADLLCNPTPRYCIDKSLICNGVPNCGVYDHSDENGCLIKILIIVSAVAGPLLLIAVVAGLVVYCKRRKAALKEQEREQMDMPVRGHKSSPVKRQNNQLNGSPCKTPSMLGYGVNTMTFSTTPTEPHRIVDFSPTSPVRTLTSSPVRSLAVQPLRSSPPTHGVRYPGRGHPVSYQMVNNEDPYSVTV